MTDTLIPAEQAFVLEGVDWQLYEMLLAQIGERHIFITYDRGRIELMSPSWKHDKRGRRIGILINVLAEELNIPIEGGGSATFRRHDLEKGLEPDECFYIRNVEAVRGKAEIDLSVDPPPDLAIEIEISRRVIERVPLYEALGVPELWRDDGAHLRVFVLDTSGHYRPASASLSFPTIPIVELDRVLGSSNSLDETSWTREVRSWVRQHLTMRPQ